MATASISRTQARVARPDLDHSSRRLTLLICGVLSISVAYIGYQLVGDLEQAHAQSWLPFLLLFVALLIALGFEFVNGFHDTANAVATVIYIHAMPAQLAVVWSGFFNFLGVLLSSGLVAFSIVSLLPVELILKVGSAAGFAMVFALLVAAIVWNLGTWYLGLPSSSSHTLIGSIIGVGLMNRLMHSGSEGTSGVDWGQATTVGEALLLSPVVGFIGAALMLLAMKLVTRQPQLYAEPKGAAPPPLWIRSLLIFTCTAVSFAHGSNEGQKGMGLIMLILIGTVPTAYALNRAVDESRIPAFIEASDNAITALNAAAAGAAAPADPQQVLQQFVGTREFSADVLPALAEVSRAVADDVRTYGSLAKVPTDLVRNVRNDMYLISESFRVGAKYKVPRLPAPIRRRSRPTRRNSTTPPSSSRPGSRSR
jgi:inorganic phosphate transporter, PiT family